MYGRDKGAEKLQVTLAAGRVAMVAGSLHRWPQEGKKDGEQEHHSFLVGYNLGASPRWRHGARTCWAAAEAVGDEDGFGPKMGRRVAQLGDLRPMAAGRRLFAEGGADQRSTSHQ